MTCAEKSNFKIQEYIRAGREARLPDVAFLPFETAGEHGLLESRRLGQQSLIP